MLRIVVTAVVFGRYVQSAESPISFYGCRVMVAMLPRPGSGESLGCPFAAKRAVCLIWSATHGSARSEGAEKLWEPASDDAVFVVCRQRWQRLPPRKSMSVSWSDHTKNAARIYGLNSGLDGLCRPARHNGCSSARFQSDTLQC